MASAAERNAATVFVRNLPYDISDGALETLFSDKGPVRRAFIVRDRKTKEGRGFGFVSFALAEDATRAVAAMNGHLFSGRKLAVDIAKTNTEAEAAGVKRPAKAKRAASTSTAAPERPAQQAEPAAHATGAAPVPAAPKDDAEADGGAKDGAPRELSKAAKRKAKASELKALRLIVRNLSFRADEAALRKAFEPHGTVLECHVPMKADGKHPGFGFVQMSSRAECEQAVAEVNEQKIAGRMVAVDMALSKREFAAQASADGAEGGAAKGGEAEELPASATGEESCLPITSLFVGLFFVPYFLIPECYCFSRELPCKFVLTIHRL